MNDNFRKQVKMLKCVQNISYKEIAEYLEVNQNSIYSWLAGNFNFSEKRLRRLEEIISDLG